MVAPYTQSIELTWRPELRFYERRVSILQSFDDRGMLRAFRFQENFVEARLFESRDLLRVGQGGLELQLSAPSADPGRAWSAVELALSSIEPKQPRNVVASFQHLAPLDLPFGVAIERAYGSILCPLDTPGIHFGDWAVLVDFDMPGHPAASGQVEFGIIRAHEAEERLTRSVSRTGFQRRQASDDWDGFADVSLFSDGKITIAADPAVNLAEEAPKFWRAAREEMGTLVAALQSKISDADNQGVSADE